MYVCNLPPSYSNTYIFPDTHIAGTFIIRINHEDICLFICFVGAEHSLIHCEYTLKYHSVQYRMEMIKS